MKKAASIALVLLMVVSVFAACSKASDKIIGTWKSQSTVLGIVTENTFTFNEDGTGKMSTVLGLNVDMTYTITDENLIVTYSILGTQENQTYTYSFDKETLTLISGDTTYVLTKQTAA